MSDTMVDMKKLLIGIGGYCQDCIDNILGVNAPETVQEAVPHERTITIVSDTCTVDESYKKV